MSLTPAELDTIRRERIRRELVKQQIVGTTFPKQRDFVEDLSPRKAAVCTRRAGKTVGAAKMLRAGVESWPKATSLYLALSRGQAKNIMWRILKDECPEFEFGEVELTATHPNGHKIICSGADNPQMIERLRGGAYLKVVIDEPASFKPSYLRYLIEDVITPAQGDYGPAAQLALIGTPNAICSGFFHDITTEKRGWSVHKWSLLDNSMFPYWRGKDNWKELAEKYLRTIRKDMQWDENHPTYLREYCGLWVRDEGSLVYVANRDGNSYDDLPGLAYDTIIGIDLGYDDATAFAVLAFSEDASEVYEIDGFERSGMIVSEICEKAQEYIDEYGPVAVVCDSGGLGKSIVEEMRRRFKLPVAPAEKTKKLDFIELLNDDLRRGKVKLRKDSPLFDEWELLQWDTARKKEAEGYSNHRSDAFLYAWRESLHWTYRPKEVVPSVHDPRRPEWEAKEMERQMEEQWSEETAMRWWEKTP